MTTKAKGTSIRQKIIDLGKKLGVEQRDLETVFMIERLVARLIADKKLASHLVFKGGFVGLKIYESPRYTVDLDALLLKANIDETLERVKQQAESDLNDGVWFRFESQTDLATQGEYGGIRHSYRAGIGEVLKNLKKHRLFILIWVLAIPSLRDHRKNKPHRSCLPMMKSVGRFTRLKPSVRKSFMP